MTCSKTAERLFAVVLHHSGIRFPSTTSEVRQAWRREPLPPMTTIFRDTLRSRASYRQPEEEPTETPLPRSSGETTRLLIRTTGTLVSPRLCLGGQCSRFPTLATRAATCCSTVETAKSATLTATSQEPTGRRIQSKRSIPRASWPMFLHRACRALVMVPAALLTSAAPRMDPTVFRSTRTMLSPLMKTTTVG